MESELLKTRRATLEDFKFVSALYRALDDWHLAMHPDLFQSHDGPPRTLEYINSLIDGPDKALLVAEMDGELCGLVELQEESSPPLAMFIPRRMLKIDSLVVAEAYRRKGVARALMNAAYEWVRERGIDTVRLKVYSANAEALGLYEVAGFTRLTEVLERKL